MDDLRTRLNFYQKDELRFIGRSLGLRPFKLSDKKAVMVETIAAFILGNPEAWLDGITETELNLLRDSIAAGKEKWIKLPFSPLPTILENLHIIAIEHGEEFGDETYTIIPEVYDAIKDKVDGVIAKKRADGSFQLDRMILSIINIYGMVPFRVFMDALDELCEGSGFRKPSIDEFSKSVILMSTRLVVNGQLYLGTPYMQNPKMILDVRKEHRSPKGSRYAKINVKRALEAAELMPFGTYGVNTPEGQEVIRMLRSLGYTEKETMDELHDIWLNAQYPIDDRSTEMLFAAIDEVADAVGHFDQYEECAQIIADYANMVPKWLLRGFSAKETGVLAVDIKVEESERFQSDPVDSLPDYLRRDLPRPDSATDVSKYGIAIKRVGLSDPCPCGSGLTYGRCHGKHIN